MCVLFVVKCCGVNVVVVVDDKGNCVKSSKQVLNLFVNVGILMCMIDVYVIYYDKYFVIDVEYVEMGLFNYSVLVVSCNFENVVVVWNNL